MTENSNLSFALGRQKMVVESPNLTCYFVLHQQSYDQSCILVFQGKSKVTISSVDIFETSAELQFSVLQLLANGVCETLLGHVKKTSYKYSIQSAVKLQEYCISIHDAIRDERQLHAKVCGQLGKLVSFKKLFTGRLSNFATLFTFLAVDLNFWRLLLNPFMMLLLMVKRFSNIDFYQAFIQTQF